MAVGSSALQQNWMAWSTFLTPTVIAVTFRNLWCIFFAFTALYCFLVFFLPKLWHQNKVAKWYYRQLTETLTTHYLCICFKFYYRRLSMDHSFFIIQLPYFFFNKAPFNASRTIDIRLYVLQYYFKVIREINYKMLTAGWLIRVFC